MTPEGKEAPQDYEVIEAPISSLDEYWEIPIRYEVRSVLEVVVRDEGLGGLEFVERKLEMPYVKDYDALGGGDPIRWISQWDVSNWGLFSAQAQGRHIGGCLLAFDTDGVQMLDGRSDIAALWDLRVHPDFRAHGIGRVLFERAVQWARARRCIHLRVETQNTNVPACRFYVRQGCTLGSVDRFAYPNLPHEAKLIWQLTL